MFSSNEGAGHLQMKHKRYTEEQIIGILREAEAGVTVADLCRLRFIRSTNLT